MKTTKHQNQSDDFFQLVYSIVYLIPEGRVTTYGAIAKCLGAPKSARLVGYAMNNCHGIIPKIPAHRVVNRNGLLTGKHHFESPFEMQELLNKEGVKVINDQVVDFKSKLWIPDL